MMSTSLGSYGRIEQLSHMIHMKWGGGGVFGTADVAYCSNVVSGILICEQICIRGRGSGRRTQGRRDVRFQCYQAKISIFQDLLLHL